MPSFQVLEPLKYDGKRYAPGQTITLDERTAAELRPYGVIGGTFAPAAPAPQGPPVGGAGGEGTPLPETFPGREPLEAAGIRFVEQLADKAADDLTQIKGIGPATAKAILAARDELKA